MLRPINPNDNYSHFLGPAIEIIQKRRLWAIVIALLLLAGSARIMGQQGQASSPLTPAVPVYTTGSNYWLAASSPRGKIQSGQAADILLSGIGFNESGGPLLFNHLGGIASDGTHLIVADRNNNRVLLWNSLPNGNQAPDLVLGQKSFTTNDPGDSLGQLNWPSAVAMTPSGGIVVADANNNRILIWTTFPTSNGEPANFFIQGSDDHSNRLRTIVGPWGVWTNGTYLAVTSTFTGTMLVWTHFPTQDNQSADYAITGVGAFNTPRDIMSDSSSLLVYDHNVRTTGCPMGGTLVWKRFPSSDVAPDYCIPSIDYFDGAFGPGGTLWTETVLENSQGFSVSTRGDGEALFMWNSLPSDGSTSPALIDSGSGNFLFDAGDTSGMVITGGKIYMSMDNGNRIVVFNQLPTSTAQNPDFAIGAPDIYTNTLETNFIMSNPQPLTDGKSLWVVSDFDQALYVYKNIPDQSGAHPDLVYNFSSIGMQPQAAALYGDEFVLVGMQSGQQTVYIWSKGLPLGQQPDSILMGSIGSAMFKQLDGVALDNKYLYLSDFAANEIYVFPSLPTSSSNPLYTLSYNSPGKLSSDGTYLTVTGPFGTTNISPPYGPQGPTTAPAIYTIADLSSSSQPKSLTVATSFSPHMALLSQGELILPDSGFNRIWIWNSVSAAIAGGQPNVTLGCQLGTSFCSQGIAGEDTFYWPSHVAYDGTYLWVGEFKFSERLLRFSGPAPAGPQTFTLSYGGNEYQLLVSNTISTVTDLAYRPAEPAFRLNVTASGLSGSLTLTFPVSLLNGSLSMTIDGAPATYKEAQSGSTSSISISYGGGEHTIVLASSSSSATSTTTSSTSSTSPIPEFPAQAPIFTLAVAILTVTAVVSYSLRRRR